MPRTTPIANPRNWTTEDHNPDVYASLDRLQGLEWAAYELHVEVRNLHLGGVTALPRRLRRKLAAARDACAVETKVLEAARSHGRAVAIENRNRAAAVCAVVN